MQLPRLTQPVLTADGHVQTFCHVPLSQGMFCCLWLTRSAFLSVSLGDMQRPQTYLGRFGKWLLTPGSQQHANSGLLSERCACVCVCEPPVDNNLHPSWNFVTLKTALHYITCRSHLKLMLSGLHHRYIKPLSLTQNDMPCTSGWDTRACDKMISDELRISAGLLNWSTEYSIEAHRSGPSLENLQHSFQVMENPEGRQQILKNDELSWECLIKHIYEQAS